MQYDFVFMEPMFGQLVRSVEDNEFLFAVALMMNNNVNPDLVNDFICSGSLVTRQDVITSAHGIENIQVDQVLIYAGSIDLINSRHYKILWWITYNDWAQSMNIVSPFRINDIANIRVSTLFLHKIYRNL
jgi:hypothetical protein